MDDFHGLLARDFGFRPQGKSAPMAASKSTAASSSSGGTLNFGLGSGVDTRSSSLSSNQVKRDWNSNSVSSSSLDNLEDIPGSIGNQRTNDHGGFGDFGDVFGRPPKYTNQLDGGGSASLDSSFIHDSVFHGSMESGAKSSPSPVYDKPVYDDNTFDGVPGLKSTSSVNHGDVFSSSTSPSKRSAHYDDLLGNLGRTETELKSPRKVDDNVSDFDDLIPGFGGSSPPKQRETRESNQLQQPTVPSKVEKSPKSEENFEAVDDEWLTVSEISLFTQPTSAPPPSRPPPSKPEQISKAENGSFSAVDTKKKISKFSSFQHSPQNFQSSKAVTDSVRKMDVSSVDELEDFAMGRLRNNADECAEILSSEEELDTNSAAAAMKEAVGKAEAKFKHAREARDRENTKSARSRDAAQLVKDEKAMQDSQERDLREKQERLNCEQEQRERDEKEREQRREEREKEKGRQAVERATKEVRERAAAAARQKAERVAVGKVHAEARGRAERASVQRAQTEAREREAAEAREKEAAQAREWENAEARERVAAAVARAEAIRLNAKRAAADREAAEAREKTAAVARENKKKNENDLESNFGMSARPTSVPRTRTATSDTSFDVQFQNRAGPEGAWQPSTGTSSSMRKASSTTNFVDDLTSIFGGAPSSGEFQEIEGESEERRRARLESIQRTRERAEKALAEKNQRDLQTQREQAELHRIAETVDIEIKRWAAGKEGNLLALLSTLQYVLWPESGWRAVSISEMLDASSAKKVYRKATLCLHPDKVQQKGANLQQKYIAEKVFDLIKEAWNKFNSLEPS